MQQLIYEKLEDYKDNIDFGIITFKEEEFDALLEFFKPTSYVKGKRYYNICKMLAKNNEEYIVAITRCSEQGNSESQNVTRDLIEDLSPTWLMIVGIAGGIPNSEFSLGDVILCNRLHDFCVSSFIEEDKKEFAQMGGPMEVEVQTLLAQLPAFRSFLEGWQLVETLKMEQPNADLGDDKFYGDEIFQNKLKELTKSRFGDGTRKRPPIFVTSSIASSDILVKDTELVTAWKLTSRQINAVEMELAGVYIAARRTEKQYPILAIRGISDIVGFKRSEEWTIYACRTAASFAKYFILAGLIPAKKKN